jgi:maltose/moltooligosaccharide transporter
MKKTIFVLGFGWFALQAIWTTYNAFMPLFYGQLTSTVDPVTGKAVSNLFLVGLLMTTDNIAALLLGPFWGARSDLTRHRLGRRLPYILVGMPLAAIFTMILPFFRETTLIALVAIAILMNIATTIFRAPLAAFFSDLFPRSTRTQVSGITDLMAGIGAIVALLVGGELFDINPIYPFIMVGIILFAATLVLRYGIKEPPPSSVTDTDTSGDLPANIPGAVRELFRIPEKSPLLFMAGIFFTWTAWNGIESFWTTYATRALGMQGGDAANFAAILALSYLIGAVPAGYAAARFGRQRTMIVGMLLLIPLYLIGALNQNVTAFAALLGIVGICWSLVLVNGIILFQEFASPRQIGLFSGLYAIGTAFSQIIGPPVYGALMDAFGPQALWYTATVALVIGVAFFSRVREGRVLAAPASL